MRRLRVLFILITLAFSYRAAAAQPACDAAVLDRAANAYEMGWFSESLDLLHLCAPAGFSSPAENAAAYKLIALSYIAIDSLQQARMWVKRLVDMEPRHRADPQSDPPLYVRYVDDLRPRWYTWLWRGGEWYKWAGRGLIVAGAVALPMVLGSSPEPDLPGPPIFPTN